MFITPNIYKRLVNLYLAFISTLTLFFVLLFPHTSRNWVLSDWLINYEGGFVRRGLPGEVAFRLSHLLHISPLAFPIIFCIILYTVLLLSIHSLAMRTEPNWWTLALLTSPATFAFQVMDIGAGGRKELIFVAGLALFLVFLQRGRLSGAATTAYLSIVVVVGVLSHELVIFYTPYFFAALVVAGRTLGNALKQCALPLLLGVAATLACAAHPGNFATASTICTSLGEHLSVVGKTNTICGGGSAVAYLTVTRAGALEEAHRTALEHHYLLIYPLLTLLAIIPAAVGSLRLLRTSARRDVIVLWSVALVSFVGSLLLFVLAIDWGRWIYIHVISIAMILFFIVGRQAPRSSIGTVNKARTPGFRLHPAGALLLVLNAVLWTLPHANAEPLLGYIDTVRDLRTRFHRHETSLAPQRLPIICSARPLV